MENKHSVTVACSYGRRFHGEGGNRKMAASCESPFSQFSFAPSPEQVVQCVWKKKTLCSSPLGTKVACWRHFGFPGFPLKIPFF
uniref:Uncharacterized protein n=1 Tax=Anguilla anguilla TaxID=7936 RepID=A0A0E9V7L9_ANGAN